MSPEQRQAVLETVSENHRHLGSGVLLTQAEAAKYLNVFRSTIFRMRRDNDLTPVFVRGLKRYRREDLETIARGEK